MADLRFTGQLTDQISELFEVLGSGVTYGSFGSLSGTLTIGSSFLRGANISGIGLRTPTSGSNFLTGTITGIELTRGSIPDLTKPIQIESVMTLTGLSFDALPIYDLAERTSAGSRGDLNEIELSTALGLNDWTLEGSNEIDQVAPNDYLSLAGNDLLQGFGGNDTLNSGDGSDTLHGGEGDDILIGGESATDLRDIIFAGAGNDQAQGGYGNDQIYGMDGNDTIIGGFGADELYGQAGDDVITGSAFSDLIFGGAGNDFVNGGFGHDRINGGSGADKFFHSGVEGHGSDWVQDFNSTEGDVLIFGIGSALVNQFQVQFAHTESTTGERAGDDTIEELFVVYRPTGQIIWALVDGAGQDEINLRIGDGIFDLLG